MRSLFIAALFLIAVIVDGIIMPALFGFRESFLVFILLAVTLVAYGDTNETIVTGLILSLVAELLLGLYFGMVMLSWLAIVWFWRVITQFFNVKPYTESSSGIIIHTSVSLLVFGFLMGTMALLERIFYGGAVTFWPFVHIVLMPREIGYTIITIVIVLVVLRWFSRVPTKTYLSWTKNTA